MTERYFISDSFLGSRPKLLHVLAFDDAGIYEDREPLEKSSYYLTPQKTATGKVSTSRAGGASGNVHVNYNKTPISSGEGGHPDYKQVPAGGIIWITVTKEDSPLYGRHIPLTSKGAGMFVGTMLNDKSHAQRAIEGVEFDLSHKKEPTEEEKKRIEDREARKKEYAGAKKELSSKRKEVEGGARGKIEASRAMNLPKKEVEAAEKRGDYEERIKKLAETSGASPEEEQSYASVKLHEYDKAVEKWSEDQYKRFEGYAKEVAKLPEGAEVPEFKYDRLPVVKLSAKEMRPTAPEEIKNEERFLVSDEMLDTKAALDAFQAQVLASIQPEENSSPAEEAISADPVTGEPDTPFSTEALDSFNEHEEPGVALDAAIETLQAEEEDTGLEADKQEVLHHLEQAQAFREEFENTGSTVSAGLAKEHLKKALEGGSDENKKEKELQKQYSAETMARIKAAQERLQARTEAEKQAEPYTEATRLAEMKDIASTVIVGRKALKELKRRVRGLKPEAMKAAIGNASMKEIMDEMGTGVAPEWSEINEFMNSDDAGVSAEHAQKIGLISGLCGLWGEQANLIDDKGGRYGQTQLALGVADGAQEVLTGLGVMVTGVPVFDKRLIDGLGVQAGAAMLAAETARQYAGDPKKMAQIIESVMDTKVKDTEKLMQKTSDEINELHEYIDLMKRTSTSLVQSEGGDSVSLLDAAVAKTKTAEAEVRIRKLLGFTFGTTNAMATYVHYLQKFAMKETKHRSEHFIGGTEGYYKGKGFTVAFGHDVEDINFRLKKMGYKGGIKNMPAGFKLIPPEKSGGGYELSLNMEGIEKMRAKLNDTYTVAPKDGSSERTFSTKDAANRYVSENGGTDKHDVFASGMMRVKEQVDQHMQNLKRLAIKVEHGVASEDEKREWNERAKPFWLRDKHATSGDDLSMRPAQVDAIEKNVLQGDLLNADEVGGGKTMINVGTTLRLLHEGVPFTGKTTKGKVNLVVAPDKLVGTLAKPGQWRNEISAFVRPEYVDDFVHHDTVTKVEGQPKPRALKQGKSESDSTFKLRVKARAMQILSDAKNNKAILMGHTQFARDSEAFKWINEQHHAHQVEKDKKYFDGLGADHFTQDAKGNVIPKDANDRRRHAKMTSSLKKMAKHGIVLDAEFAKNHGDHLGPQSPFGSVGIDEAHDVFGKSSSTGAREAARAAGGTHRFALTGTPMKRNMENLFDTTNWITHADEIKSPNDPRIMPSKAAMLRQVGNLGEYSGPGTNAVADIVMNQVGTSMSKTKTERDWEHNSTVIGLKPGEIEMTHHQKSLLAQHEIEINQSLADLKKHGGKLLSSGKVQKLDSEGMKRERENLEKRRHAGAMKILHGSHESQKPSEWKNVAKANALHEHLKSRLKANSGHKVLIFAKDKREIEMVRQVIADMTKTPRTGPSSKSMDLTEAGATGKIHEVMGPRDSQVQFAIGSPDNQVGTNAQMCDEVINFSQPDEVSDEEQRDGRDNRPGRKQFDWGIWGNGTHTTTFVQGDHHADVDLYHKLKRARIGSQIAQGRMPENEYGLSADSFTRPHDVDGALAELTEHVNSDFATAKAKRGFK
jgi:hypothetical protein